MGVVRRLRVPCTGVLIAATTLLLLRGFTVDDALISARYATHVAQGAGYRFNVQGPVTDGVTPLPWAILLAPFAGSGPWQTMLFAKWLGAAAWLAAAWVLGLRLRSLCGERPSLAHLSLLVGFASPSVAAWAVSGMETGVVIALVTVAVCLPPRRAWLASLTAGVAVAFRPELLPFACVLSLARAFEQNATQPRPMGRVRPRLVLAHLALGLIPFALASVTRWACFGSIAPLAVRAKPSDLEHGLVYALAAMLLAGPPLAVIAPSAWRKLPAWPRWLLVAFFVHVAAVIAVGGDWMPLSRLMTPVLPSLAIPFAYLAVSAARWSSALRAAACLAGQVIVATHVGPAAAHVLSDRERLVALASARLAPHHVVATLDIGWVGASFSGRVVDLAGVTDPELAALPGGHTSKRVSEALLRARGVTHVIVLLPDGTNAQDAWSQCAPARAVETRVCMLVADWRKTKRVEELRSTPKLAYALVTLE